MSAAVPSEHSGDFLGLMLNAELVQTLAQRLKPLGAHQIDAPGGENALDRRIECGELQIREIVYEPFEGRRSVVGLERLGCPHGCHDVSLPNGLVPETGARPTTRTTVRAAGVSCPVSLCHRRDRCGSSISGTPPRLQLATNPCSFQPGKRMRR